MKGKLRKNIVTNYLSTVWIGGLTLALIPWYVRNLGSEQWGLVAVCMSVQAFMTLLDSGLSQIMPRDVARVASNRDDVARVFHLFSKAYLLLAMGGFVIGQCATSLVTEYWLNASGPDTVDTSIALRIVLVQFFFQFANNANLGLWNGVQAQITANLRQCAFATAKHASAITLIVAWQPTATAYLIPFALVSAAEYIANRGSVINGLPLGARRRVGSTELIALARKGGVLAIGVVIGMLLSQIDRIILSGVVDIASFGHYAIVASLALAFMQLQLPLVRAFLPRLVEEEVRTGKTQMKQLGVAIVLMCVLPSLLAAVFAPSLLTAWVGDGSTVEQGTPPLRLILIAVALNAMYQIHYQRLMILGYFNLILKINVAILIIILPTSMLIVQAFGLVGGGMIWVLISGLQISLGYFFTRKLFR